MAHVTSARNDTNGLPRVPSIPLSDDRAIEASGNHSIGHLVKDATTHLSTLVRAEIELAKSEIAKEVKTALVGSIFFIIALMILLYSSFFFFFFLADLLDVWLPRWAASLIVFGGMLLFAGFAAFLGYRRVRKIHAPERTISTLKDTAAALTHRGGAEEPGTDVTPDRADSPASAPRHT
ncbi:MAG TPA: phage holin family protein [Actinophytocola sp.]|uniref:phage holin family protein n=1 Tax=Actinophytocola sp. TaxID=1872138 RepID=UPI002DDC9E6E|nr:phage holin family protein [Actinophytocola sp.]HEV2784604.1 phage holin family protein [Actinophytocola sp.]